MNNFTQNIQNNLIKFTSAFVALVERLTNRKEVMMTSNQIDYAKHKEIEWHNRVQEQQEKANLQQKQLELIEQARHNQAAEQENKRHNIATEFLQNRDIDVGQQNVQVQVEGNMEREKLSQKEQNKRNKRDNQTKKDVANIQGSYSITVATFGVKSAEVMARANEANNKRDNKTKKWIATQSPEAQLQMQKIVESESVVDQILAGIKRDDLDSQSKRDLNDTQKALNKAKTYREKAEGLLADGNRALAMKEYENYDKIVQTQVDNAKANMERAKAQKSQAKTAAERSKWEKNMKFWENIYRGGDQMLTAAKGTSDALKTVAPMLGGL